MRRLAEMDAQTDALSQQEEKMKAGAGTNAAVTGAVILVLVALFVNNLARDRRYPVHWW